MCDSQHQGPGGGRSYALPPTLSTSTVAAAAAAPPQYPPPALRPRAVAALTLDAATAAASPSLDVSSSSSSGGGGAVDVIWSPPPAAAAFSTLAAPSASAAVPSSDSLLSIISEAAAVDGGITAEVGMGVGVCATVGGIASAGTPPKAVFVRGNPVLSVGSDGKAEVSTKLVRPKEIFDPGQPQQSVPMSTASFDDASSIAALDPGASTATGAAAIRKSFAPISLPSPALDLASTAQVPLQQVPFSSDSLLHHQRIFSGHHYQENKWPKPCKPDVAGGASFRGLGSFTSPSGAASPWSSLSANDDVVDPTLNPVGGADDVLEEPIDVTLDAAAGGIFSGIITSSAPSPVAVSTKTIKPLVIPGSVDNSQLLQQSQQQALRLVSAAAAVPVPIAVPPPTLQAANTTSTITVPRISVEQGAPATIATVPLDSISVTGVGNDFAAPNACTSSAAGAIRLIPEAAAPTTGIVSSSVLPPVAVANVSAAPALTNVSAVRLVPSSVPSSASASGPPSRAAQVRILPDEFKHPAQATSQQRRKDVKVVSVLNLSASNAQQQTVSVSPQGTPLPTVVLKPIVQNTRSSSTSAQRRPSAVISSSASVTRSSASSRRPRQEIGASLSQPSQHLQASPQSTDPRVESVSCFKCRECGFLGLSARAVEEHCLLEHEEQEAATLHNAEGTSESGRQQPRQRRGGPQQQVRPGARRSIRPETSTSWLAVAIQEGVKLQCPLCSNQFSAESSRSFIVHVTDDHGKDDGEAEALFQEQRDKRRVATIEALRSKRRKERERRRRAFPEEQGLALEAYIDGASGDLRVRTCSGDTVGAVRAEGKAENNAELDLSAEDYMSAMDSLRSGGESSSGSSFLLRKIKEASKERKDSLVRLPPPPKRGRVGRPRGSRSLGITRLRKAAAAAAGSSGVVISLSDLRMGAECGVGDCAVRMRSAVNLERHRKSHADPESAVGFRCTECQAENTESSRFEYWSELALHLWRKHRVDMELFRCEECEGKNDGAGFRCFTQVLSKLLCLLGGVF